MMSLALVTLGIFSYRTLGVDLMPKTDPPNVNVQVQLPGASVEEVETTLSKPIEETLNTINGIDELRTTSNQGNSNTNITFNLEKNDYRFSTLIGGIVKSPAFLMRRGTSQAEAK